MLPTTSLLCSPGGGDALAARPRLSAELPRANVLVVGESGAGKTTLVRGALKGLSVHRTPWTVGATIEYVLHYHRAGTPQERPHLIELWDVGGSRAHRNARRIFYRGAAGAVLVHDMANRKTEGSLRGWTTELFSQPFGAGAASPYTPFAGAPPGGGGLSQSQRVAIGMGADEEAAGAGGCCYVERDVPLLVVGTKLDRAHAPPAAGGAVSKLATELGCEELCVNALSPLAAGSTNALKLDRFYERVIGRLEAKRLGQSGGAGTPTGPMVAGDARRRRLAFP